MARACGWSGEVILSLHETFRWLIDHELDGIELIPFPFQLLAYEYVGIEGGDNQKRAFLMMRTFSPVEKNKMPEG